MRSSWSCIRAKSLRHVRLRVSWTVNYQVSSVHGIFQAEYGVGCQAPPPGDLRLRWNSCLLNNSCDSMSSLTQFHWEGCNIDRSSRTPATEALRHRHLTNAAVRIPFSHTVTLSLCDFSLFDTIRSCAMKSFVAFRFCISILILFVFFMWLFASCVLLRGIDSSMLATFFDSIDISG